MHVDHFCLDVKRVPKADDWERNDAVANHVFLTEGLDGVEVQVAVACAFGVRSCIQAGSARQCGETDATLAGEGATSRGARLRLSIGLREDGGQDEKEAGCLDHSGSSWRVRNWFDVWWMAQRRGGMDE